MRIFSFIFLVLAVVFTIIWCNTNEPSWEPKAALCSAIAGVLAFLGSGESKSSILNVFSSKNENKIRNGVLGKISNFFSDENKNTME